MSLPHEETFNNETHFLRAEAEVAQPGKAMDCYLGPLLTGANIHCPEGLGGSNPPLRAPFCAREWVFGHFSMEIGHFLRLIAMSKCHLFMGFEFRRGSSASILETSPVPVFLSFLLFRRNRKSSLRRYGE
jgi:hypothetical protein